LIGGTSAARQRQALRRRGRLTDVVDQLLAETAGSWPDNAAAVMEDPTLLYGDHPDHEETDGFIDRLIAQTER
jgi:carboxylate-amine ligase